MNKRGFELTTELQEFFTQVSEVMDMEDVEFEELPVEKKRTSRMRGEDKRDVRFTTFLSKKQAATLRTLAEAEGLNDAGFIYEVIKKALETATSNA